MVYGSNGIYSSNRIDSLDGYNLEEQYTTEDVRLLSEELYDATILNDSIMIESIIGLNEGAPQLLTESVKDVIDKVKTLIKNFIDKIKNAVRNFTKKIKDYFEEREDKSWAKQGFVDKVYERKDGKRYVEDYDFSILVGQKLDVPFESFEGLNSMLDIIDPFKKLAALLKAYCDMIKDVNLKMARLSSSYSNHTMTDVDVGDQMEKCMDELDHIEQKAKDAIDDEKRKFVDNSKIVKYDTITQKQATIVHEVMQPGFEKTAINDLNQAQKACEDDAKEYISTLDSTVRGKSTPMDQDQYWIRGDIGSKFNGYVQQVTRIMTYFTTSSESIASSRMASIGKFVEIMTENSRHLAKQKAKILVARGEIKKLGYSKPGDNTSYSTSHPARR